MDAISKPVQGLIQDRQGLCKMSELFRDEEGTIRDRNGYAFVPGGKQVVRGWFGLEGEWDRLAGPNGFTFLVRPNE